MFAVKPYICLHRTASADAGRQSSDDRFRCSSDIIIFVARPSCGGMGMEQECDKETIEDERLLALHAQDGTNRWLGQLYSRYLPLVYGVCLKYLRNPDDAGDAVMDIFEELTVKVGRYEVERFRPWLYTRAKNHGLQRLRRKRLEIPADDAGRIMEYAPLVHLLDGEGDEARFAALERCLERLPEKQRECIDRFFYGGKSYADISAETCWPVKSIKSFLQNGKRNLKLCMEKEADETD